MRRSIIGQPPVDLVGTTGAETKLVAGDRYLKGYKFSREQAATLYKFVIKIPAVTIELSGC